MHFEGLIIGVATIIIIGIMHPIVIKTEFYVGEKAWPLFLITGLACLIACLFITSTLFSALLAVTGVSLLWSIQELFEQTKRVARGWFPHNPHKKKQKDTPRVK
jgi:uncharacterized membrane protein